MTNTLRDRPDLILPQVSGGVARAPGGHLARSAMPIAILAVLLAHIAFVFALRHETWDGTIFEYWLATNDFRGIDVWYRESNGFITLWLMRAIHFSDWLTAVVFHTKAFNVLAIVLYPPGAFMILRFVGATMEERLLATLVVSLSPILLLYASIMNALIMIYIGFCWIGLSLLERAGFRRVLALALIVISCQLWSNYAVVMAFLAWRTLQERRIRWEYVATAVLASATIYFLLFHFDLSGPYTDYNSVVVLSVGPLIQKLIGSSFASGFLPVFTIYVAATGAFGLLTRRIVASHWYGVAGVALFYVVAAIPYLMVDKPPPSFRLLFGREGLGKFLIGNNYDYRHLLPAYCWIALAIAATIMRVFDIARIVFASRPAIASGAAAVLLLGNSVANTAILANHLWQRNAETVVLVQEITEACDRGPVAGCVVDLASSPHYLADIPRQYELNYLYFKAFGALGAVDSTIAPEYSRQFAEQYACRSDAHALAYLFPYAICNSSGD
jgi:hypothetical protein